MPEIEWENLHDCRIHGISTLVEDWHSQFRVDLDVVVQAPCVENGEKFHVAPALLTFHHVTDLSIRIEWGESGYQQACDGPYIERIVKSPVQTKMSFDVYYRWDILLTDGRSRISLGATSAEVQLTGEPVAVDRYYLKEGERASSR